jgi:hypothetical protein
MTRNEMLKRMDLTDEDLKDLVHKFKTFHSSLNERQRAIVTRSLPNISSAAKSFGNDVTAEELQKELGLDRTGVMFVGYALESRKNQ